MTNLGLELLILTVLLIYFGVFMTQSIYRKCNELISYSATNSQSVFGIL